MTDVIAKTIAFGILGLAGLLATLYLLAPLDDEPSEREFDLGDFRTDGEDGGI